MGHLGLARAPNKPPPPPAPAEARSSNCLARQVLMPSYFRFRMFVWGHTVKSMESPLYSIHAVSGGSTQAWIIWHG